jgi:hypothetical protein
VSAATSNGDGRARTSAINGARSTGPKTPQGLLAQALSGAKHGIKAWTPVLPTERQEDWIGLREGINKDWHPVGRTQEDLTYCLAMAFWQRRRLYQHEKELILRNAKEEANPYPWSHHMMTMNRGGSPTRQFGTEDKSRCVKRWRSARLFYPCFRYSLMNLTRRLLRARTPCCLP